MMIVNISITAGKVKTVVGVRIVVKKNMLYIQLNYTILIFIAYQNFQNGIFSITDSSYHFFCSLKH